MSFSAFAAAIRPMRPRAAEQPRTSSPGASVESIVTKLAETLPGVPVALPAVVESVSRGLATVRVGDAVFADVPVHCVRWSRVRVGGEVVLLVSSDGPIAVISGIDLVSP